MIDNLVPLEVVMVPLSKALGLSLVVERVIEVGKNLLEPWPTAPAVRALPDLDAARKAILDATTTAATDAANRAADTAAEQKQKQLQSLTDQLKAETDAARRAELAKQIETLKPALAEDAKHGEWDERVPVRVALVEDANDPDDGGTMRALVLQLLGLAAGIVAAKFADVRLFTGFLPSWVNVPDFVWVDHVLTGLFIGGGSGPVHTLIEFISARKMTVPASALAVAEAPEAKAPPPAGAGVPAIVTAPADIAGDAWVDVPYEGGVDVALLETVHRRTAKPDLVVYHHTAMSSESSFEDVVRVIKSRTDDQNNHWLTGYNCVILADGSVHAFCRWDRYGSHAVGYNARSLGIAFNGNFETDPRVPSSNPDGRYGPPRPTEAQLRAGARVVTLWTFLYPIALDFDRQIIPHRQIASKACPGSQFPYAEFRQLVAFYRSRWEHSPLAQG